MGICQKGELRLQSRSRCHRNSTLGEKFEKAELQHFSHGQSDLLGLWSPDKAVVLSKEEKYQRMNFQAVYEVWSRL